MIMMPLENILMIIFTLIFIFTWSVLGWNVFCLFYIDFKGQMPGNPVEYVDDCLLLKNEKWLKYKSLNDFNTTGIN